MHDLATIIARNNAQQNAFDKASQNGEKKMSTRNELFDRYITEGSEVGFIDGVVKLLEDMQGNDLLLTQLETHFPKGPMEIYDLFVEKYPDVALSSIEILEEKIYEKRFGKKTPDLLFEELMRMLNQGEFPDERIPNGRFVTAPNCKNPNCQNPACPNYKGRRITGKNKIGYIN